MFRFNEENYGIKSTYDSSLSLYTLVSFYIAIFSNFHVTEKLHAYFTAHENLYIKIVALRETS